MENVKSVVDGNWPLFEKEVKKIDDVEKMVQANGRCLGTDLSTSRSRMTGMSNIQIRHKLNI